MLSAIERVESALSDFKKGKMIILTDDSERENEGDLIIAAEHVTTESMNFMIRNGSGIVCVAMLATQLRQLDLPLMISHDQNTSMRGTPFTISVDAREGITTGVSAHDRTVTIKKMMESRAFAHDLVKPGHIFPLQAKDGGVFERQGHTEGAVDLARLSGCKPAAVLCEIMNPDGTMSKGDQLSAFANRHQLAILSIDDIMTYRIHHENLLAEEASASFLLDEYGNYQMSVYKEKYSGCEHVVLMNDSKPSQQPMLVRIHSSCFTGDLFASRRCDCNKQLRYSLQRISDEGGVLIYLNQEGRGIGLFNKIRAYALQEKGYDTVQANEKLGLPVDSRKYYIAANILKNLNINEIRLMTNNPGKVRDLKKYGIKHVERIHMPAFADQHNQFYLQTKKAKLNHDINMTMT
ncbi:Riboflavin biosynthesis protein RibBA [Aquicella siphonis]|uniref:Multifunctional fusion protein n=1 Tax=Aquicella siphonis TaxID=254247 RepID=A0A5E4PJ91_9COXI|nr:3,4-dihydroxy-2-butanone-4-phosphate synthase [Aquicella siphonis]VVC77034.1 Riboflavin biosynthesis protein RibBA [Aquicella siphonis]